MQSFLQNQLGETVAASSPAFVEAVTLCHERFLHVVAAELASASQGDAGVQRVTASHVEAAMRELGMEDLLQEAKTAIAANSGGRKSAQPSKATRKKKNRSKQFTEEEIAEQERLLASSKDKLENWIEFFDRNSVQGLLKFPLPTSFENWWQHAVAGQQQEKRRTNGMAQKPEGLV